jgi:hypothetical protein
LGATSRENPCEVGDTLGLFLLVQPSGGKRWQVKHRIDDKKKQLGSASTLGSVWPRRKIAIFPQAA